MKNYRLKPEAVLFFKEKYATAIKPFDEWEKMGIDDLALQEVEEPYLTYGHQKDNKVKYTAGWEEKGAYFLFTIHFPSVEFHDFDKFSNGKIVRDLMNKIQYQINSFFIDFKNSKE